MRKGLVISVSGIRGVVGGGMIPEIAAMFAAAHGAAARERTGRSAVVVGRDARVSGPVFEAAVEAGLRSVGCDVLHVGLACTPTILLMVEAEEAAAGIAITASHNPADWNALKLASHRGMFLTSEEGEAVVALAEGEIPRASWDALGRVDRREDATSLHVERVLADPLVDRAAVRAREFTVALDTCAGAGGVAAVPLLDALGVTVEGLHLEPTGRFPRDPEPTAANLSDLAKRVRAAGADLGAAIDPDGDRLALVDETGRILGEDHTLALAADHVLGSGRQGSVVTNLSTSQVVDRVAEAHGASVVRTAVGEVNVVLGMLELDAPIGGEGNGGVIHPGIHHTRDAMAGLALVLSHLARSGETLSRLVDAYPVYAIRKAKLPLSSIDAKSFLAHAAEAFADADHDRTDGLRCVWPDREAWLHLRRSGTEPVVRVIAEAPEAAEAERLLERARSLATV